MIDHALQSLKPKRIDAMKRKLQDELLVYDPATHRGYCLNRTASLLWLACDGEATVSEIATRLTGGTESEIDEATVLFGMRKLDEAGLFADAGTLCEKIQPRTRREILRRLGSVAVIALPAVASILVPVPASASSCFPLLHLCTSNAQCCSGRCGLSGGSLVCLP